jgi:hypothetical protein
MEYLEHVLKLIIGLSVINVWLFRARKSTPWRGGSAKNLQEEFATYGLPAWFMTVIGGLKVLLSLGLIASIWIPALELYTAGGIGLLMIGAIAMHIKVGDPLKKSFPAAFFLILSLIILFL